jgi:transcription initiation factor TFIID subunit 11
LRRSPSVDGTSLVSGSQVSATGPPKKKRGRKAKNADAGSKEQTPSLVGGRAPTTISASGVDRDQGAVDDDDEADGPLQMELVDATARTKEQKQEESRLRAHLVEAFDRDQMSRYEIWRASRLPDAVVRRVSVDALHPGLITVFGWMN